MDTSSKLSDIHNTESNSSNKSTNESSTLDFIPEIENTESTSQTENTETDQSTSQTKNTETEAESKSDRKRNYIRHQKELNIVKQLFYENKDEKENVKNRNNAQKWISDSTGITEPEELGDFLLRNGPEEIRQVLYGERSDYDVKKVLDLDIMLIK